MRASDLLLDQWERQVKELFPSLHSYQQDAIAFSVQSVVQAGTAVMQRVAETAWDLLSRPTKLLSHERRLQRFVANERIDVDQCWQSFLETVLPFWHHKPVTLIIDLTPYTQKLTIVYIGLLVHSRVLPLVWWEMPQQETWEQGLWDLLDPLVGQLAKRLETSDCTLLADRGLACLSLIQLCEQYGWHYVLRITQATWMRRQFRHVWRLWEQAHQVVTQPGDHWYGRVVLWQEHERECWLSAAWQAGHEQAWFVISDRKAAPTRLQEYARRMRVEATFQDDKSRGCFIENSHFRQRDHLHRWLFVVFLAQWWTAHLAGSCIHHGQRGHLDRTDRRDKGVFRLGRLWLKAMLKKAEQDMSAPTLNRVKAQLANCLPCFHRQQRLFFSIYLR